MSQYMCQCRFHLFWWYFVSGDMFYLNWRTTGTFEQTCLITCFTCFCFCVSHIFQVNHVVFLHPGIPFRPRGRWRPKIKPRPRASRPGTSLGPRPWWSSNVMTKRKPPFNWVNLITTSLFSLTGIMFNKRNHPQMALIQAGTARSWRP